MLPGDRVEIEINVRVQGLPLAVLVGAASIIEAIVAQSTDTRDALDQR